jgi:hypothetical protein
MKQVWQFEGMALQLSWILNIGKFYLKYDTGFLIAAFLYGF